MVHKELNVKKSIVGSAIAALGLGFMLASAPAAAQVNWFSPITAFEDDNLDWVIGGAGGTLNEGDRLISVLKFNQYQGISPGQGPILFADSDQELTGVSDITVLSKVALGGGQFAFTFGATANGFLTGGAGSVSNIAGAMVTLWLDDSPNLVVINGACGTQAECIAAASDGLPNPYMAFGVLGDDDAYWTATGSDSIGGIAGAPASTKVALVNFGLNILENNTGQTFGLQNCALNPACDGTDSMVNLIGSADILGGQGLENGAFARSDTDAQLLVEVPEPGSLALLAVGLLAAGVASRKRVIK